MSIKLKTETESNVLKMILSDIESSQTGFSTLTNNQIAAALNVSVFSIRDKIIKLDRENKIQNVLNYWHETNGKKVYHNRVIHKGNAS
jgi:hypothetical protein